MAENRYTTIRVEREVAKRVIAYRDARDHPNASEAVRELLDGKEIPA